MAVLQCFSVLLSRDWEERGGDRGHDRRRLYGDGLEGGVWAFGWQGPGIVWRRKSLMFVVFADSLGLSRMAGPGLGPNLQGMDR